MAAAGGGRTAAALLQPVTFVTGNAKKLEEVRAILGNSIPFRSLKLDCTLRIHESGRLRLRYLLLNILRV